MDRRNRCWSSAFDRGCCWWTWATPRRRPGRRIRRHDGGSHVGASHADGARRRQRRVKAEWRVADRAQEATRDVKLAIRPEVKSAPSFWSARSDAEGAHSCSTTRLCANRKPSIASGSPIRQAVPSSFSTSPPACQIQSIQAPRPPPMTRARPRSSRSVKRNGLLQNTRPKSNRVDNRCRLRHRYRRWTRWRRARRRAASPKAGLASGAPQYDPDSCLPGRHPGWRQHSCRSAPGRRGRQSRPWNRPWRRRHRDRYPPRVALAAAANTAVHSRRQRRDNWPECASFSSLNASHTGSQAASSTAPPGVAYVTSTISCAAAMRQAKRASRLLPNYRARCGQALQEISTT